MLWSRCLFCLDLFKQGLPWTFLCSLAILCVFHPDLKGWFLSDYSLSVLEYELWIKHKTSRISKTEIKFLAFLLLRPHSEQNSGLRPTCLQFKTLIWAVFLLTPLRRVPILNLPVKCSTCLGRKFLMSS